MKLAHYQIEHIREWINMQNIWYDEIKDELLDHMVCAVEQRMANAEISFVNALAEVCKEVNPTQVQRQKLKFEHFNALKETFSEMKNFDLMKVLSLTVLFIMFILLQTYTTTDNANSLKIFMTASAILVMLFGAIYTYKFRQIKPLSNAFVFSRINGIYLVSFLYASLPQILFWEWLLSHSTLSFIYIGLQFWFIISGIKVLYESFNKLKHAL